MVLQAERSCGKIPDQGAEPATTAGSSSFPGLQLHEQHQERENNLREVSGRRKRKVKRGGTLKRFRKQFDIKFLQPFIWF